MENGIQERPLPDLKSFKTVQKAFAIIGIDRTLATQAYPFNWTILTGFLILGLAIISSSVYITNEAETFFNYTQSVYVVSIAILFSFLLLIQTVKVYQLFEYIDACDRLLNASKSKTQMQKNPSRNSQTFCL